MAYLVHPNLRPREELSARIEGVKLERGVSLGSFLSRVFGLSFDGLLNTDVSEIMIYAHVDLHGMRDREYMIWGEIVDAGTETPIVPVNYGGIREAQETFSPQAPKDRVCHAGVDGIPRTARQKAVGSHAAPLELGENEKLVIRVRLYELGFRVGCRTMQCGEPMHRLLDVMDSRPFRPT